MISSADILKSKILIVDDQQVNILLIEQMLSAAGYDSITSTLDPKQVYGLHIQNHYDLILLDLQMPGMDGFEVMEDLKKIEPDGYLPVLVITAQPLHKLRALEAGAKDFISKPFELPEVLARVHNLLEVYLLHKELRKNNEVLEQQLREQATLLAISHTLASTLQLQPGLILEQMNEIIAFTHGGLFALEGSTLVTLAMRGTKLLEQSEPIHLHLNDPEILETLFNKHQPIRIADVWSDAPQAQFFCSLLDDGAAALLEGMQSWMWIPFAVKGRLLGGLGIAESTKNFFTNQHANLGMRVANQSAITIVNADLYGQAQELAVLEERQQLAHNLHDAVNQSLFSVGLIAEALPQLWDLDQEEARRSLEELRRLTRGASAEMRTLLAELRPSTLTDSRLSDLFRLLGNAFTGRTNIPVTINIMREFMLPAEVQVAFYRICQEALNNISKHANSNHVEIDLKQYETVIELTICDDGKGFNTEQLFPGHYGLGMMREHAEAVGGILSIMSQSGQGTKLTIRWTIISLQEPI
jgi:signal transduction histidine kinase